MAGRQAYVNIYTSIYTSMLMSLRFVCFVWIAALTRGICESPAPASPFACDLKTKIQTASESSQSCHLSTCEFPKTSTKHIVHMRIDRP